MWERAYDPEHFDDREGSNPRCGGSGVLYEELTPQFDHRDPRHEVNEWECPGCPDCALDVTAAIRWCIACPSCEGNGVTERGYSCSNCEGTGCRRHPFCGAHNDVPEA